jgi:hypothetical protein
VPANLFFFKLVIFLFFFFKFLIQFPWFYYVYNPGLRTCILVSQDTKKKSGFTADMSHEFYSIIIVG